MPRRCSILASFLSQTVSVYFKNIYNYKTAKHKQKNKFVYSSNVLQDWLLVFVLIHRCFVQLNYGIYAW